MIEKPPISKIIELYKSGKTMKEIGNIYGINRRNVSKILKTNKVVISKSRQHGSYISKSEIIELYLNKELSTRQIAKQYGYNDHKKILRLLKKHNIPIRDRLEYTKKRKKILSKKRSKWLLENPNSNPMKNLESIEKLKKTLKETGIRRGENNPAWKGGVTPENMRIRRSSEMEVWRNIVFERDGYKCQICESNINIEANHIKKFSTHKQLRTEPTNGITLCKNCHNAIAGKEQFLEEHFIEIVSGKEISQNRIKVIRETIMSKTYYYRNKEWLNDNYMKKGRQIREIAKECNVHEAVIHDWLNKFKIPRKKDVLNESELINDYRKGMSIENLQIKYHLAPKSVKNILEENAIQLRHIHKAENKEEINLKVKQAYENGMSKRKIKEKFNMGWDTIIKLLGRSKQTIHRN